MPADTISGFGYTALNISDAKVKIINRDFESDKLFSFVHCSLRQESYSSPLVFPPCLRRSEAVSP